MWRAAEQTIVERHLECSPLAGAEDRWEFEVGAEVVVRSNTAKGFDVIPKR